MPTSEKPTDAEIEYIGQAGKLPPRITELRVIEEGKDKYNIEVIVRGFVQGEENGIITGDYKSESEATNALILTLIESTENTQTFRASITEMIKGTTYTIRIIAQNAKGKDEKTVDITPGVLAEEILINKNRIIIGIKDASPRTLTATIMPENTTNKKVKWTSSNTNVATVENGVVTPKTLGTTNITVTTTDGSNRTATCIVKINQTEIIRDQNGNKITVPGGFEIVENGTEDVAYEYSEDHSPTVQDGVVIRDEDNNQFVWIPVSNVDNLGENKIKGKNTETEITLGRYSFNTTNGEEKIEQKGCEYNSIVDIECQPYGKFRELYEFREGTYNNNREVSNATARDLGGFVNSVKENGGFYIARYEASLASGSEYGIGNDEKYYKPASKKGKIWTGTIQPFISKACRNMYYESSYVISDLTNSYAWDTTIVYIQTMGFNNYANYNSSKIGNTGENGDEKCHIYDMAGNATEWTTEYCTTDNSVYLYPFVNRGGSAKNIANQSYSFTASRTYGRYVSGADSGAIAKGSFRPILYIK
ncbi:MAG: hypothetical protein HFJ30_03910 [Clostridia bacterium]|nr:hypothetical protein [Clostridia bacterium]